MFKPYIELAKKTFQNNSVYRINTLFGIINTIISIFVYVAIWKAIYNGRESINGIDFKMISTHFIITIGISNIFLFDDNIIADKVCNGSIAHDLLKPINFNGLVFAHNMGNICFKIIIQFFPALLVSVFFIGIYQPASILTLCFFLVSLILGILIYYFINYIVSITAFWFYNIFALQQIKNAAIMILSGALLPVWFMPELLVKIIKMTPFEAIYSIPIAIYMGQISTFIICMNFVKQIAWITILLGVSHVMWKKAINRLVIQGG